MPPESLRTRLQRGAQAEVIARIVVAQHTADLQGPLLHQRVEVLAAQQALARDTAVPLQAQRHLRPRPRELRGASRANPLRRAGNQHDFSVNSHNQIIHRRDAESAEKRQTQDN